MRNLLYVSMIFSLARIIWQPIGVQDAAAQPEAIPPDVFKARPGSYLVADYPGVFDDNVEGDGITVEAWIYLTDRPDDWTSFPDPHAPENAKGRWIFLVKPGSYLFGISGRDRSDDFRMRDPEGTSYFKMDVMTPGHYGEFRGLGIPLLPEEYPFSRWLHLGLFIHAEVRPRPKWVPFVTAWDFFDGVRLGWTKPLSRMGRSPYPLMIGGTEIVTITEGKRAGTEWGHGFGSMVGYIDEIRVSLGDAYNLQTLEGAYAPIHPKRRLQADANTIALWHFDEGPNAPSYGDSSGNGYTLRRGGSIATAVESRGKLATTWGRLKTRQ